MRAFNASSHGVDLDSGRVLVPGEHAHIDDTERHTDLVNAGLLVLVIEEPEPEESEPAPAASPTTKPTSGRRSAAKQAKEN